jgi:hypothetical protein
LEGTIQTDLRSTPVPFSGVLELLRVLEDEVPASPELGPDHHLPS